MAAKGQGGAHCCPAADPISPGTQANSAQRPVNHDAAASARRAPDGTGVPCTPMEGMGSGWRHGLDHCKGLSQRFLLLRVARYACLHNHGPVPWRQAFAAAVRCMFSTTGDDVRWMTHQHRRLSLTLCYR
jgi:hypothetical protein